MTTLDLGLIGNSRTSALIDRNGAIVWWCYPYFDSDPLCSSLLQSDQKEEPFGFIDVKFDGAKLVGQEYERNSAILVSRFQDDAGNAIEVTDFAPRFYLHGRMFSPSMLVRIVRRISGRPQADCARLSVSQSNVLLQLISFWQPNCLLRTLTCEGIGNRVDFRCGTARHFAAMRNSVAIGA